MSDFIESIGLERVSDIRFRKGKSVKQRVLDSIKSEISLIESREDLALLKVPKTMDGVKRFVNENRFWKTHNEDKSKTLFNIKVKGKIFGMGEEVKRGNPKYFQCESTKDSLIKSLNMIYEKIDTVDENKSEFWFLGSKPNTEVSTQTVVEETEKVEETELVS